MPRPPCLNIPGATYHVCARGHLKEVIFFDDTDRYRFMRILANLTATFHVDVLTDCQMGNHFHLVATTPNGNLSEFMQQLDGQYGQYLNRRHNRIGHVFQGPFKRVLIEHDIHLLIAIGYVLMNPIVAGLVERLEDWKWSSYRATAGLAQLPSYLSIDWLDEFFPAASLQQSQQQFREFVAEGWSVEAYLNKGVIALGSNDFKAFVRSYIGEHLRSTAVPRSYRALGRPALDKLISSSMSKMDRARAIQRACVVHGYKQSEIARALALHPSSISRIICSLRNDQTHDNAVG